MALGFVGPLVKSYLAHRGYVITRPTEIERSRLRSYWQEYFSLDPELFGAVYARNRETLRAVRTWISEETLERSLWRYGVPEEWANNTNSGYVDRTALEDIESEVTSADLLAFLARRFLPKLSYLEIGVSVGKTLLQMNNQVADAQIVGLDVEEINPILRDGFDTCDEVWRDAVAHPVETLSKGMVSKYATCHRLTSRATTNIFHYVSADQFRDETWSFSFLKGRRFNLVFSDGVHTPEALRSELQFLIRHDLIDNDRFFMVWDDLVHPLTQPAFLDNAKTLCRMFNRGDEAISLYSLHGSYGFKRLMGLFSSAAG
jgi:hypothetical protein